MSLGRLRRNYQSVKIGSHTKNNIMNDEIKDYCCMRNNYLNNSLDS